MDRLPHTFDALLARFGRLTEIQARAIEPLLAGRNCVLAAATASGKTEAALAPMLERYLRQRLKENSGRAAKHTRGTGVRVLYLVPTRALARDVARRLAEPLSKLAISMAVKTGDEPALKPSRPPEFLITTPESLDSLLANRPRLLSDVRAVVLDELHLYDHTARGDQLRILLNRLRRIRAFALSRGDALSDEVQFCALSATMYDAAGLASRYFVNPVSIQAEGRRALDAELLPLSNSTSLREFLATLRQRECKKVLAFCQRRAECEEWAHLLRGSLPFGDDVLVHHASLSGRVRHAVEEKFARAGAALCFATQTLELGIDIGDVDLILLIGPPDNFSSFLQRLGRGNRRTARTAVACFYRTPTEQALFRVFLRAARNSSGMDKAAAGTLLRSDSGLAFRPSVVVQQLCSYLKQTRNGELEPAHAYQLFVSPQGKPLLDERQYMQIVDHLIETGFFLPARGTALRPGPQWHKLYEERTLYSNLADNGREAAVVIDDMTGRRVGYLESVAPTGTTFLLGGQARRVVWTQGRRLLSHASTDDAEEARAPRWRTRWQGLSPALTQALARELGLPCAVAGAELPMLVERGEGLDESDPETVTAGRTLLFHCAGGIYGKLLGELLETKQGVRIVECNEFLIEAQGCLPETMLLFTEAETLSLVSRRWRQFERAFALGRFQPQLPPAVRRASVIAAFNVPDFQRRFAGCKLSRHMVE
ncbi:MAG: DEAD/DEAH box helicase [Pyrinomonadaceae bacterium]|nr:DEAD/DEAH box helicase [Pyrinomonadaceae bacterium]